MPGLDLPSRMPRSVLYSFTFVAFAVLPACACCDGASAIAHGPAPTFAELVQTAPAGAGLEVGPEVAVVSSNGSSDVGLGARCNCASGPSNVGVSFGAASYFPESGSSYGAWVAARYDRPTAGPVNLFGMAGPVWSYFGYSSDEYRIPEGEFSGLGGGGFGGGFGDDSNNAFGVRLGVGAALDRPESQWTPFGEVGYDVFLAGADFDNQLRFSAGVTYSLGSSDR